MVRGIGPEFFLGKLLGAKMEETHRLVLRVPERVRRQDLELEARWAGSLLAAHNGAARALVDAADVAAAEAAAAAYLEKLEQAEAAVNAVHEKALASAGVAAAGAEGTAASAPGTPEA